MSTLELENIKHPDNAGNNITLAADGTIGGINKREMSVLGRLRLNGI